MSTDKTRRQKKSIYILPVCFVMMQDGKVLPDGPVVISPDGLFPSLYREGIHSIFLSINVPHFPPCIVVIFF